MTRSLSRLLVEGVTPETKRALQQSAKGLYGKPNASLLVRQLITAHLAKGDSAHFALTEEEASDTVRVELRLPRVAVEEFNTRAEGRFSRRNYYMASILLAALGSPQLQGDEIEVLRRSNYELAKVGTNLNQIAKAFNILAKLGGDEKTPEIGKKIASLRREVSEHTNKVLRVLNAGTVIWESVEQKKGRKRSRKGK